MATFVLVHGAFVGGWCWRWITPHLVASGHEVFCPTLTGLGERVHLASPQVNLETHIQDIINTLHYADLTDVVLVGWSYGGMVVAGVVDRVPDRIGQIVYLDSDVPRDGDTSSPPSAHARLMALAREHGDGWRVPPEVTRAPDLLLTGLPERQRASIAARLVAHPLACWTQPIRLTGGASLPTTYIRCTADYNPSDEDTARQDARIRSEPHWRVLELAERHAIPFTAPTTLARTLLALTSS